MSTDWEEPRCYLFDLWVGGWASGLYWEELDLATYEDVVLSVSVPDCYGSIFTLTVC